MGRDIQLPVGWIQKPLEECVEILDSKRIPINSTERDNRIHGKDESGLYPYYGATGQVGQIDGYIFDDELILLGEDGAPFLDPSKDKAYLARGKFWVNNHAHVLKAKVGIAINKYILHYLNFFDYHDYVTGTTRLKLNQSQMRGFPVLLPPLPEQERIVAKIEELFSRLDAGTAALRRIQAGLKRYKASLLKAACEGRLVPQDPNDEPASELLRRLGKKPLEGEGLSELPEGWCWTNVNNLAANEPHSVTDGPFGSNLKTAHYTDTGPRVIRLQNIGDGVFRDERAHISQEHFERLKRHQIFSGDLVIAGLGESLPRACLIPEYVGEAIVKADCIRFKPDSNLALSSYLLIALNSDPVRKLVSKIVHGIGRPRLNKQEIKAIPIPLPTIPEQQRIVNEVERQVSVITEIEVAVEATLARSARLRQSILKRAFEGRLVGQPNQEGI